jgi:hemolysin activation/secretion protein
MASHKQGVAGHPDGAGAGVPRAGYINIAITALSRSLLLALGLSLSAAPASAQPLGPGEPGDTPAGGIPRPGDFRPSLPPPAPPPEAPIETPQGAPLPEEEKAPPAEQEPAPYGVRVFVKEIRLSGNTVFSSEELDKITAPYTGRIVASSELEDLRVALTRFYIDRGYINSGAVIPDQQVVNGIVQINIIEGRLTDIQVVGNKHLKSSYIKDRIELADGPPLNVQELQDQIQIMLESPVLQTLNSQLRPGDRPGEANLTTQVQEGPRLQFIPVIDNRLSPSLGDVRVLPQVYAYDLTGHGDVLSTAVGVGKGLTDAYATWAVPLNAHDTTLTLLGDYTNSQVKEGDFKDLDIKNKTRTFGFRVSQPVYRTPSQTFSLSLGMDLRSSQSELLGEDFAFTPGVPEDGEVKASIIRFSQDWSKRSAEQVLAARSMFSLGIDAFDATTNSGSIPSGEFFAWLGQFQWARRIGVDGGQLIFRTDAQLSTDELFTMEQFSVGGALSVRGYRENQLVRDYGFDASLEYRYPLIRDPGGRSILALAPFIDAGGAKNNELPDGPNPTFIYSAGAGLRWDPTPKIHSQLYWGHAFRSVDNDGTDSLQDDGIHFLVSANLYEMP